MKWRKMKIARFQLERARVVFRALSWQNHDDDDGVRASLYI
jgi:hypothetical protein